MKRRTYGHSLHRKVHHGDDGNDFDNVAVVDRLLSQSIARIGDAVCGFLALLTETVGELQSYVSIRSIVSSMPLTRPITTLIRRCIKSTL